MPAFNNRPSHVDTFSGSLLISSEEKYAMNFLRTGILICLVLTLPANPSLAKDPLRVAMAGFDGTDDVIFLVTQGARLFEKNGLKTELIAITGASPSSNALSRGEIDIDARSPVNAILARLRGLNFTFVAATLNYLDYTIITRPGVNGVGELKGKKIGIVRFGGKTDLLVRYLFRQLGLEPIRDFAMIQVGPPPARIGALQTGAIDATVLPPGQSYTAVKMGLRTMDIPYAPFLSGVIGVREAFIKEERATLVRFLKAYTEGIHFFLTRKEDSLKILSRAYRNSDMEWVEHLYRTHQQHQIGRKPFPNWEAVKVTLDMMVPDNPEVKKVSAKSLFDLSLLEEIDRSGFINQLYQP
jgi:NitT/TauT family transport system substrate-binding protein